MHQLQAPKV